MFVSYLESFLSIRMFVSSLQDTLRSVFMRIWQMFFEVQMELHIVFFFVKKNIHNNIYMCVFVSVCV